MTRALQWLPAVALVASAMGCLPHSVKFVPEGDAAVSGDASVVPTAHPRCGRVYPTDLLNSPARYRQHIVLGSIFSYADNVDTIQAAELAVRQANATGGFQGRQFGIVHCNYAPNAGDTLSDIDATTAITRYLINDVHVPVIIGPRGSPRAIAALTAAQGSHTVIISPSATSTTLTTLDNPAPTDAAPGFFWRTVPLDTLQAQAAVSDMVARTLAPVTNVAVVYDSGAYGMSFSDAFVRQFTQMGGTARLFAFPSGTLGTVPQAVTQHADSAAFQEVLFISSNLSDHTAFLAAVAADPTLLAYYSARGIFFSAAGYGETLLASPSAGVAMLLPKIRGTRPATASGSLLLDAFSTEYTSQYGTTADTSTFAVNSYDAAWLAIYGIAWSYFTESETITGLGIARGLRHVSTGATPTDIRPGSWPSVQNAFRQRMSINVQGASGRLDYDPVTEETVGPIEIWRVDASGTAPHFVRDHVVEY